MSKLDEALKAIECVEYVRDYCGRTQCEDCPFFDDEQTERAQKCTLNTFPYMVELEGDAH